MKPRSTDFEITTRAAGIIKDAGYLTVATTAPDSTPWAAQLQYAWFTDPLRFVVGSAVSARHTRHVLNTGVAAAALSTLTGTAHGLDGLQMAGDCRALSGAELTSVLEAFYQQMFTDPAEARAQALPVAQLDEGGPQRLLELRPASSGSSISTDGKQTESPHGGLSTSKPSRASSPRHPRAKEANDQPGAARRLRSADVHC